jgi:hypothetical protein
MKEDPSQEQSLKERADLFSDPASSLSHLGKGNLSASRYSESLHLALWLEFFLIAGKEPMKEKLALMPLEEQTELGIELLKCYLFQPLYIRLSMEQKTSVIKAPLTLESQGKLFQVEYGIGKDKKKELLYPLDHFHFWPGLFGLLEENFFSSEKVLKALEPGIILTSSSRLEKIRHRAETLGSLFLNGKRKDITFDSPPEDPSKINDGLEDTPGQAHRDIHHPRQPEPNLPISSVSDPLSPFGTPKRKKKKKSSMDQMELF